MLAVYAICAPPTSPHGPDLCPLLLPPPYQACKHAYLKSILATGELGSLDNVYKASLVCMMAGSDTIKVSVQTGLCLMCLSSALTLGFVGIHPYSDIHWQGKRQCHFPCGADHAPRHSRISPADGLQGRIGRRRARAQQTLTADLTLLFHLLSLHLGGLQASWRHPSSQGCPVLASTDEGGVG